MPTILSESSPLIASSALPRRVESRVRGLAEHPHSVPDHRGEPLDTREEFGLLLAGSMGECGRGCGQARLEHVDRALEVLAGGAAAAPALLLRFGKIDDLRHTPA